MSHELLHVFKHTEGERFLYRWKVVEEFRERPAMFQIVEQRSNRYTAADEYGRSAENLGIRMNAGKLTIHRSAVPGFEYTPTGCSSVVWLSAPK